MKKKALFQAVFVVLISVVLRNSASAQHVNRTLEHIDKIKIYAEFANIDSPIDRDFLTHLIQEQVVGQLESANIELSDECITEFGSNCATLYVTSSFFDDKELNVASIELHMRLAQQLYNQDRTIVYKVTLWESVRQNLLTRLTEDMYDFIQETIIGDIAQQIGYFIEQWNKQHD